ncbi:MAG: tetratricopeptide repeat protein [Flavobacteriales bacterium]
MLLLFTIFFFSVSSVAQVEKGREHFAKGNFQEALNALENYTSPDAILIKADAWHKLGEFELALGAYFEAEESGCLDESLLLNRAICLISLEKTEEAEYDLLSYFVQDENNPKVHYYLAAIDYLDHNLREAHFHLDRAIELWPDYMDAHYLKAAVFIEQNKPISAQKSFQFCNELQPENMRTQLNLAIVNIELLQFTNALDRLVELEGKSPEFMPELLYYKGLALNALHQQEEACESWDESAKAGDQYAQDMMNQVCVKGRKPSRKKRKTVANF